MKNALKGKAAPTKPPATAQYPLGWVFFLSMLWFWVGTSQAWESPVFESQTSAKESASGGLYQSGRQRVTEQLNHTLDAGDFYLSSTGRHHLFRLAGSISIRLKPPVNRLEPINTLTGAGGPLEGYKLDVQSAKGLVVLNATRSERQRQHAQPGRLDQVMIRARAHPDVQSAHPVFVEPATGLGRMLTEEILLRLKPQVNPQTYFGQTWTNVKRLAGTRDQFLFTVPVTTAQELFAEVNRRAADPRVAWAEPNFISQVLKQSTDPLFFQQWPLHNQGLNGAVTNADVNALGAWTNSTGSPRIVIAIMDDGVQLDHPDLKANIFSNPGESLNSLDDDGNGYVDDLHGWDFYSNDNDPSPVFSSDQHGTAAAGIAAAVGNNGVGVAGVAYGCQIMPLKVITGGNWASDSSLAEAIYYAGGRTHDGLGTWRGADVISISLGFPQSSVVDSALLWASTSGRGGKGCPVFGSAGDDASRWKPTRIRLRLSSLLGPGTYRFGFEYSKDVSSAVGEDLARIDNVALLSNDGVTQLNSPLGPDGRQDFEGTFPPLGWELSAIAGAALWTASTNGALTGTRGSVSAQSGLILDNEWTELRTPFLTLTGSEILSFSCYISSEATFDGLKIWIYDTNDNYVSVFEGPQQSPFISGNANIATGISYPASHPAVIAVGASTDSDVRSDYSQTGPELDLLAPSSGGWSDILTTDRTGADGYSDGDYVADFGGTSAACPLAAGIGALVLSVNPSLTASEVRTFLRNSCDKVGEVAYDGTGWNPFYGFGRINAQRAVDAVRSAARANLTLAFATSPASVNSRDQFTYILSVSNQGPATAFGVVLTNVLSDFAQFVSSAPVLPLASSNATLVFDLGDLPSGALTNVSIVAASSGTGTITNRAVVTSTTSEVDPTDNEASATILVESFFAQIINLTNNSTLLAPANITIAVSATDLEGTITNVEFFSGTNKIGQATHPPFTITWLNPPHGKYSLSVRATDNHGKVRRSKQVSVSLEPGVSVSSSTVVEGNAGIANALFSIRLSSPSSQTVTVNYSTADGTGLAGRDYLPTNGTVVFLPGTVLQNIFVPVVGSTLSESNKTFLVDLSNPVNAAVANGPGIGTILDTHPPPALFINDVTVTEGDIGTTDATFIVRLSTASGKTVTVNYSTASGTAVANLDFVPAHGTLIFPPGVTNQQLAVPIIGDTLSEYTESFLVNLSSPTNAILAHPQGVCTILDNDPNPSLAIGNATLPEGNVGLADAIFAVSLSAPSGKTITVNYSTANGTAVAGRDFVPLSGTLIFPAGTTSQLIRVGVIGNTFSESNEVFWVNLTNAFNATIAVSQGVGTILDDDPFPALSISDATVLEGNIGTVNAVFSVRLSAQSGRLVTVDYATGDGSALAGLDYVATNGTVTFPPGTILQNVFVPVIGDFLNESNETFVVSLANPVNVRLARAQAVGLILDNDPPPTLSINDVTVTESGLSFPPPPPQPRESGFPGNNSEAMFTVRLSAASGKTVTINYATANGTALSNLDYLPVQGTLIFLPGVTNQTLAVRIIGDTLSENADTFLVNLSSPTNAILAHPQGIGTILNNVPFPSLAISDATVTEGNLGITNAVFAVSLSAPSGRTITVNYSTANGTAVAGQDFFPAAGILTFPAGTTNQLIRVSVIGDSLSESNEIFWVNLTNAVNATISRSQGAGTIVDDDPLPALSISDAAVLEGNIGTANALFLVRLSAPSGRPITVDYATADGTALGGWDYVGTNGTVNFPPGTTLQTILVAAIGDTLNESNETFLVELSNPVNASIAHGQGVGTILDDDPRPTLFINDVTVTEGDVGTTNAVFTVRLSVPSGKTVSVNYSTANGTALGNLDFVPAHGTLSFSPGMTNQTLAVPVIGDLLCENTETFFVNLSLPINAVIAQGQGVGTILDNDFKITAAKIAGTNVLINFGAPPGRASRIEFSDQLRGSSTNWSPVPGGTNLLNTGSTFTVTNRGGAAHSNRFYRIRLLP